MSASEDVARIDAWFSREALHGLSSPQVDRYLTSMDVSNRAEATAATLAKDAPIDLAPARSGNSHDGAAARGGNGPSTNPANPPGANALAGIGSAVGGTSTGSSSGGGSAGGSGGGASGAVNQLNTLGIQGAFAGSAASAPAAPMVASTSPATIVPLTSPPPPAGSTFNFVEGTFQGPLTLATFTNPSGDPNAQYSATVDWGGGTGSATDVIVTDSTIQVNGNVTYPEEGTFPITVTVSGPGGPLTATDTASVADAALAFGGISPISATAGQPFSSDSILTFSDDYSNAPASDYSVQVDWGDGTGATAGSTSGSGLAAGAGGSHTYANPGTYPVSITVTDDGGSQVSGSTTATVSPPSSTVIANDDSYTLPHDSTLSVPTKGVLGNDTDSNNLPLSAGLAFGPSHGTVNLNGDGSFTYTPTAGYDGIDSFTYTASNGQQTSDQATVTLSITDSGTITTSPDSYSVLHDHTLTVPAAGVLGNDSDSDGDSLMAAAGSPSHGALSFNSDGSFIYAPNIGYVGTDSFTYTARDGAQTSLPTNVTIDVTDQVPVAANQSYGVPKDGAINVPATSGLLSGASDADGDFLTASLLSDPSSGSLSANPDGSFTYTPNSGFTGADSFTYQVNDGALNSNTATVTLTIHTADTAPIANPDSYSVERNNPFSTSLGAGVLANDSDADGDTLTAELVSSPAHGALSFNGDGSFNYTPNTNYFGTDSFTYKASDGVLTSDPATVGLTVNASPPTAADQTYAVQDNNTLNVPSGALLLGAGNPDNMTPLTAQDVSQPSHGALTVNADGSFTYTPNTGFTGTDTFTYEVSDGTLTSDPATVTILVNATNSPPTAGDLSYSVNENQTLTVAELSGLKSAASDPDGDPLLISLFSGPSYGALALSPDGSFTYTPTTDYHGTDSFQYRAFDGTSYSNAATVTITVNSDVPTAGDDAFGVAAGAVLNVAATGVLANDSDEDGLLLTAGSASGVSNGSLTLNGDGSLTYTPNLGFTGTDSFTYRASNGIAESNLATVTIDVHGTNLPPTANDDAYNTSHNTPLTIEAKGVLGNDTDPENDPLSAALMSSPSNGSVTLNGDGSFTYTPNNNYVGTDSFTYVASDGQSSSNPATVAISVTDNPPTAGDDSYTLLHDQALTTSDLTGVLSNDSDADGDPISAQLVTAPSNGTLQFGSGGGFTYIPNLHFAGTDSFTYKARDGMMSSDPATVFLFVTDAAPIAADDTYSMPVGPNLTVTGSGVLANDVDPDNDPMTAQVISGPANGALMPNSDGSFTYTPGAGFTGMDTFTYQASDGILTSNTATVTITSSTLPVANNDEYATGEDVPLSIAASGVLGNDTAPDEETLTAGLASGPANGSVALSSDGSFTYTPNAGFIGNDTFSYYAFAGGQQSATPATVTVHVSGISMTIANPWIPINANDDNKSPVANMIPQLRDFNYLRQLPANLIDPQLQPLNITINNPSPLGFVNLTIQQAAGSTGQIRLWADDRKTKQILPGLYPAVGPDALPATIYVEGVNPTSRTITGNAIKDIPVPDNTITATYDILVTGIGLVPVNQTQVVVGVTPIVQYFTINNQPAPPNPAVNPATVGRIAFINNVNIRNGYVTFGVDPAKPNVRVPGQSAVIFNAQVFNANVPGAAHFIQNETISNGGGGAANTWTFAAGGPPAENWEWFGNDASKPILDMFENQQPPPPYYQSQVLPVLGNNVQISSGDSPSASDVSLVGRGLGGHKPFVLTQVAWTFNFTLYLSWSMPQGGGILGDVIYTLATRPWSVVFQATASRANGWADTIAAASGVFTAGDFSGNHPDPIVIRPTANTAATIG